MNGWSDVVQDAAARWGTPLYVFQLCGVEATLEQLRSIPSPLPIRHWLSCKTLAVPELLREWRRLEGGIEVVSPFEYRAAISEGFAPSDILVNGTAKHRWLGAVEEREINVQFDSIREIRELGRLAKSREWRVGLRIHTSQNRDPDCREYFDQFGIDVSDIALACRMLERHRLSLECASFHLHSNLRSVQPYLVALEEVAAAIDSVGASPNYVDLGGGMPAPGEVIAGIDGAEFKVPEMTVVFHRAAELFPCASELWLENGRFISSGTGVLAIRVWDCKSRGNMRYLLCDGGRVNNSLPSDWQDHRITTVPRRSSPLVMTTVCGPTCMAYDWLARTMLPGDIQPGDLLVWHNAGAYHLAWETRFSFGLAPIVIYENRLMANVVRPRETFEQWWPSDVQATS